MLSSLDRGGDDVAAPRPAARALGQRQAATAQALAARRRRATHVAGSTRAAHRRL